MHRKKRVHSLIHSIAHHGVSALSWLHPRLGEECKSQNLGIILINLLDGLILTEEFLTSNETLLAVKELSENFKRIAKVEGIEAADLAHAKLEFQFRKGRWPSSCQIDVMGTDDTVFEIKLDGMGKKYGILSEFSQNYS